MPTTGNQMKNVISNLKTKNWCAYNKLTLNFDKIIFMKFCTNNSNCADLRIGFGSNTTEEAEATKGVCLQTDHNLPYLL